MQDKNNNHKYQHPCQAKSKENIKHNNTNACKTLTYDDVAYKNAQIGIYLLARGWGSKVGSYAQ